VNGSALARFGIGLIVACCAAPGVALADTPTLNPSGTLTFSWQGDPARGCQAAGVCAVSGSLDVIPADQSGSFETPRSRQVRIEDENAVVRVTDPGSTPTEPHICTQLAPVSMVLTIVRTHSAGLHAIALPFFGAPSSRDCAGPVGSLGAFSLPVRRLPGPREAYDLASTRSFGAGPYTVTIKSTMRARRPVGSEPGGPGTSSSSSSSSSSSGSFPTPTTHKGLVESVSMQYQVTAISGTVTTSFAGRPDPFCVPLDACGASGVVTDAISGHENRFEFDAQRIVKRRVSRRAALADLRSGRMPLQDTGILLTDVLSAKVAWPVGSACTDRLRQLNALDVNADASRHRGKVLFSLGTQVEDPFRTACPGPAMADVLGSADTLARAVLSARDLGRKRLRIVLSGHGRFVAGSYAGSRSGGLTLAMKLIRVRAGTKAQNVFGGVP
jgi:hypothetical protein